MKQYRYEVYLTKDDGEEYLFMHGSDKDALSVVQAVIAQLQIDSTDTRFSMMYGGPGYDPHPDTGCISRVVIYPDRREDDRPVPVEQRKGGKEIEEIKELLQPVGWP